MTAWTEETEIFTLAEQHKDALDIWQKQQLAIWGKYRYSFRPLPPHYRHFETELKGALIQLGVIPQ